MLGFGMLEFGMHEFGMLEFGMLEFGMHESERHEPEAHSGVPCERDRATRVRRLRPTSGAGRGLAMRRPGWAARDAGADRSARFPAGLALGRAGR